MPKVKHKTEKITFVLSRSERDALRELAAELGESQGAILRLALKQIAAARGLWPSNGVVSRTEGEQCGISER